MDQQFTRYVILLTIKDPQKASKQLVKDHVEHLKKLDWNGHRQVRFYGKSHRDSGS